MHPLEELLGNRIPRFIADYRINLAHWTQGAIVIADPLFD